LAAVSQHMAGFNNSGGPASPAAPTPPTGAPCASTEDKSTPVTDHPAAASAVWTPHTQTAQKTSLPGALDEPVWQQTEEERLRTALIARNTTWSTFLKFRVGGPTFGTGKRMKSEDVA